MIRPHTLTTFAFLAVLTAFGCGTDPRSVTGPEVSASREAADHRSTEPSSNRGDRLYPLEIGNRWSYKGSSWTFVRWPSGETTFARGNHSRQTTLARIEMVSGKEYVREERTFSENGSQPSHSIRLLRQDPSGFYQGVEPPSWIWPPLPYPFVSRLLAHPLHVGATWVFNESSPDVMATVEAREMFVTPAGRFPAWRIRIDYQPGQSGSIKEQEIAWYGDVGYLGGSYDFRSVSWTGLVYDAHWEERLDSVTLSERSGRIVSRTSRRSSDPRGSRR